MKKALTVMALLASVLLTACGSASAGYNSVPKEMLTERFQVSHGTVLCLVQEINYDQFSHELYDCNWETLDKGATDESLRELPTTTLMIDGVQRYCAYGHKTNPVYTCDYAN